ncbi:MAG TPA: mechanosensitive ion channel [Pseudomonas sabulinigri]|uniref:Mechanosensitive ion channel MscS domain-containing protein n=1 Tax=marine sediment metagenome TaxID=412755 RepID=A0A0F9TSG3_9ZZZZ|nr:mechanosensitive ion channel [Halopseudomonas sabulinigri]HEC50288.1 mechanosensitive ion channel [Halopseudomonas sabulinigri]|tara:strand:- start:691 stop:1497 length:807 start_codon:yes stop_codon:yes gene_type:complete
MNDDNLGDQLTTFVNMFNAGTLFLLFFCVFVLWLINWFIRTMMGRVMTRFPSRRFAIMQLTTLLSFVLYIIGAVVLVVGVLRPPHEFLIAIGGSAAVAIGFALKDVAASLISGLILLFDRPFQVGDRVSFDGVYGEIMAITLRTVRLRTLDDNIVTIPNSRFITDIVSSGNLGAMDMMVVTDFHLALDADIQQAQDIARQVIVTSRYAYLKKPVTFAIEEVQIAERLSIRLRAKAYVLDVNYEKAFQSDVTVRTTVLFRERGVPRPTR